MSEHTLDLIQQLGTLLRATLRHEATDHGLQPVHLQMLDYLARCNRFSNTPAALTRYLGSTKGTVSQSLRLLVERGYLLKSADKSDGRVVHFHLTKKGRQLIDGHNEQSNRLLEDCALGDIDVTAQTLSQVLRNLQAMNDYAAFGQCRTCRHLIVGDKGNFKCGLSGERLKTTETELICLEHQSPDLPAQK